MVPGTPRFVSDPLGSGVTEGGLACPVDTELDFGAASPTSDGFAASCRIGARVALEEASGVGNVPDNAVGMATESRFSMTLETTLGAALGTGFETALESVIGTAVRTTLGKAVGATLGTALGGALETALGTTF